MVVYVKNRAGKKLHCAFDLPKSKGSASGFPAVLIIHGFKGFSTQRHLQAISDALVSAGFITIRPDLTKNPGKSYLNFADMTYGQELADLAAERDEVKSLAALSAVYDFEFVVGHLFNKPYKEAFSDFKTKGWSTVWSQSLSRKFRINGSFYEDIIKRNAKKFTRDIKCPTLIVSSGNDESVAQIHADNYLKGVGAKVKKMEIIEGSDHNYTTTDALDQICQLVSGWFLSTL